MAKKHPIVDDFDASDREKATRALRQVWMWSRQRRLAKKRCTGEDGFPRCENPECPQKDKPLPSIHVDHITPLGPVDGPNYLRRLFTPSKNLMCLCPKCHRKKTNEESAKEKKSRKQKTP